MEEIPNGIPEELIRKAEEREASVRALTLPSEEGAYFVFRITFDGCCTYTGFTSDLIVGRVDDICGENAVGPSGWGPHIDAVHHARKIGKRVECLASNLARYEADQVRHGLMVDLSESMWADGLTMAITKDCQAQYEGCHPVEVFHELRSQTYRPCLASKPFVRRDRLLFLPPEQCDHR